jgi:Mannosyl-glycoprotein endo-beta-N-acetylglucosaminidase
MPDDVLRLRTTVIADEAFQRIRQLEQALARMQREAGRGAQQANVQFQNLTQTFQSMHREVSTLGRSLGTIFGGLTAGAAFRGLADVAKRLTELKYVSKELGMSERDVRAWGYAAERVGVSSQAMVQGLRKFGDVANGLRYNIGGVRNELIRLGAGPVVRQMMQATSEAERLKTAFQFKDALMRDDPTGFKARQFFDQIGLGADAARLSYDQFEKQRAKTAERTQEQIEQAEKARDAIASIGEKWVDITERMAISLFPKLEEDIETLKAVWNWLQKIADMMNSVTAGVKSLPGAIREQNKGTGAEAPFQIPQFQHGGVAPGGLAMLHRGEIILPAGGEGEDTVEEGTFKALVRFASYRQTAGAVGMAGLGGIPGLGGGSIGGGGGPGPGGGGGGGGAGGGYGLGGGRSPDSTVTPSGQEQGGGLQPLSREGDQLSIGGAGGGGGGAGGNLSQEAYEKMFAGSPLAGQYDKVVSAAKANNVPPATMAAIMAHETAKGTSKMLLTKNNPAGLMKGGTGRSYGSIGEGIEAAGRSIGKNYAKGGGTIAGMQGTYAPIGAANDPGGLNRSWTSGVTGYEQKLRAPDADGKSVGSNPPGVDGKSISSGGGGSIPSDVMGQARGLLTRGASTGELAQFMRDKGYPRSGAWCGQFAASVVTQAGGTPPKGAAIASNWRAWGQAVAPGNVQEGDVAVRRGAPTGSTGSHVTLVGAGGIQGGRFEAVGGNQRSGITRHSAAIYDFRRGIPINAGGQSLFGARLGANTKPSMSAVDTAAIDRANSTQTSTPKSAVNLTVNSNGTKASAEAKSEGPAFAPPQVKQSPQMQPTEDAGAMTGP